MKTFAEREVGTDNLYATFFLDLLTRRKYSLEENFSRLMPFDIANCLITWPAFSGIVLSWIFVTYIFYSNLVQLIGRFKDILANLFSSASLLILYELNGQWCFLFFKRLFFSFCVFSLTVVSPLVVNPVANLSLPCWMKDFPEHKSSGHPHHLAK